tara:strand:+ start:2618 stop:3151 length:534 start_codon:yes stop_codon:yes gene_type:complete
MSKKLIFIILLIMFSNKIYSQNTIFDLSYESIEGEKISLRTYKGKYLLIVNVASYCGFTYQYNSLEKLYNTYKDKLVILAFPCNQFGRQEPGNSSEILEFCSNNYNITFPISKKINVKGESQHAIYKWLTSKEFNNKFSSSVKWNFQKYLIDPNGNLIDFFYSTTSPTSKKIINYIQ